MSAAPAASRRANTSASRERYTSAQRSGSKSAARGFSDGYETSAEVTPKPSRNACHSMGVRSARRRTACIDSG